MEIAVNKHKLPGHIVREIEEQYPQRTWLYRFWESCKRQVLGGGNFLWIVAPPVYKVSLIDLKMLFLRIERTQGQKCQGAKQQGCRIERRLTKVYYCLECQKLIREQLEELQQLSDDEQNDIKTDVLSDIAQLPFVHLYFAA